MATQGKHNASDVSVAEIRVSPSKRTTLIVSTIYCGWHYRSWLEWASDAFCLAQIRQWLSHQRALEQKLQILTRLSERWASASPIDIYASSPQDFPIEKETIVMWQDLFLVLLVHTVFSIHKWYIKWRIKVYFRGLMPAVMIQAEKTSTKSSAWYVSAKQNTTTDHRDFQSSEGCRPLILSAKNPVVGVTTPTRREKAQKHLAGRQNGPSRKAKGTWKWMMEWW